jgi:ABC-type transporter Mla subunit MlaD
MPKKRSNFLLGLTIIVMSALFFIVLLWIADRQLSGKPTQTLRVRFYAVAGMPELVVGSKVVCFGQPIGEVEGYKFIHDVPPGAPGTVEVQMLEVQAKVLKEVDLRADCTVVASGPPLGGRGTLEFIDRGRADEPLDPSKPLYGATVGLQTALAALTRELDPQNPVGLLTMVKLQLDADDKRSIIRKIHTSLDDVNVLTASLAREVDATDEERTIYLVHEALNRLNVALAEVVALVRENRPRIDRTMQSVEHAVQVADTDIIGSLAKELDAGRPGSVLAQVHEAMDRLQDSLTNVSKLAGTAQQTVTLNAGRINDLVQNAVEASALLRTGIDDLRLHPWKLLAKPGEYEIKQLDVLQTAREFARAAAHLDDATSQLRALASARGGTLAADDPELVKIRQQLEATVARFREAEQALWRDLKVK